MNACNGRWVEYRDTGYSDTRVETMKYARPADAGRTGTMATPDDGLPTSAMLLFIFNRNKNQVSTSDLH